MIGFAVPESERLPVAAVLTYGSRQAKRYAQRRNELPQQMADELEDFTLDGDNNPLMYVSTC